MRKALLAVAIALLLLVAAGLAWRGLRWDPLRGANYGEGRGAFLAAERLAGDALDSRPAHRLVLVGDAGAPEPDDPTLAQVGRWADALPGRSHVVFLGDNVYPVGLQPGDERGERVLLQLLRSARAPKFFVPGNHDWGYRWNRLYLPGTLALQQEFIESRAAEFAADFEPEGGCPGPSARELAEPQPGLPGGLTLLLIDLHWWMLADDQRPDCGPVTGTAEFVAALRAELEARRGQNVVVAAHHPIRSGGPHGGYTRGFWRDLGIAVLYRFYTLQDVLEPGYREAVALLSEVLSEHPPLAMVGGHDHSLQVLDGGDEAGLVVVSGSATRVSEVTATEATLYAHAARGFVVFDLHADADPGGAGVLRVLVVETGSEDAVATFALDLAAPQQADTPLLGR